MKTKGITKACLSNLLIVLFCISYLPAVSSCQSRELSRAQAQKLIVADDNFRQIITLDYINRSLRENGRGTSEAKSADEPEDESTQSRINEYFWEEPRVQIAAHLGFVEPRIKRTEFQPARSSFTKGAGYWYFDEKWINTAKGKNLWEDYGMTTQETTVPLARREFVQITGITKIDESQRGMDFSWNWSPNDLGKALDPSTTEFKALPDSIQKNLLEKRSFVKDQLTYNWAGEHSGKALFRKYDNGWRVEHITF